jgi:putative sigma-54 modulation protein
VQILITGRHVGVTEPMKEYARAKAEKLMRYFDRATHCRVTMDQDHLDFTVEIEIEASRGVRLFGKARGPDMYASCDLAEQKLAQQLRRFKERLTDHHRGERRDEVDLTAPAPGSRRRREREPTYEDVIEEMRGAE